MNKLGFLMLIVIFLLGLGVTSNALFAQDTSGDWGDDDAWGDDDDDDDEKEVDLDKKAYEKAMAGNIKDCEDYLKNFGETGLYVKQVKNRLAQLKGEETAEDNEFAGKTPEEIKRILAERAWRDNNKNTIDDGDDDNEEPGTHKGRTNVFGSSLTQSEIEYLLGGASFWTVQMNSHAHFSLIMSQTDWEGEITAGSGSNIVLNAGAEYDVSDMVDMPVSAFADLGLRLSNKNPWDTDGFVVTGWIGGKYLIQDLNPGKNSGLKIAAALSVGIGVGDGDHEANFSMWTGHMNPPVFLVTPMLTGIVSYKLDKNQYVNGTLGFMFFVGTEDEPEEAYPLEQDDMFAIEASAEYFRGFSFFEEKFGVHGGLSFRSAYDPLFSIYVKLNSMRGPYMQMIIPFTSDTSSSNFMFMVGYSLPLYDLDEVASTGGIEEPVKEELPTTTTEPASESTEEPSTGTEETTEN